MGIKHMVLLSGYWENVKETLPGALLNTVVGILVVFFVLLFISLVISLFRYVAVFETWQAGRKEKKAAKEGGRAEPDKEEAPAALTEPAKELSSDGELVAVITAAIYAYEQAQGSRAADGLWIRSIKRSNKSKWQSAE